MKSNGRQDNRSFRNQGKDFEDPTIKPQLSKFWCGMNLMDFLRRIWRKIPDALALIVLLLAYHANEASCYLIGNIFPYYLAVVICGSALFLVTLGLVFLHDFFKDRFDWDALKLQYLNSLRKDENIPPYRVVRKMIRLVLREGFWAIFVFGSIILGPFVITVLLRQRRTWQTSLVYAACGALFNVMFWVAFMRGLGMLTWKYIEMLGGGL
jgi:hypothetical protein